MVQPDHVDPPTLKPRQRPPAPIASFNDELLLDVEHADDEATASNSMLQPMHDRNASTTISSKLIEIADFRIPHDEPAWW